MKNRIAAWLRRLAELLAPTSGERSFQRSASPAFDAAAYRTMQVPRVTQVRSA